MTRRLLLQTMAALLPTARLRLEAPVRPDDLVVIEAPGRLTNDTIARIHAVARERLGLTRVIVLTDGMTLRVVRGVAQIERPTV